MEIQCTYTTTDKPSVSDATAHIHNSFYEIFCFLEGNVAYSVEGNLYPLAPGDLILLRKGEVHQLVVKANAHYKRYVLYFDVPELSQIDPTERLLSPFLNRKLGHFNHFRGSEFPDNQWQYFLKKMAQCEDDRQKLYYLLPFLDELATGFLQVQESAAEKEADAAVSILKYINKHLTENLSMDMLAERFFLSKVHINRIVKKSIGVTVWAYVSAKRLLLARELLQAGVVPTKVYLQCGFSDYTTFYRAYVKHYGVSPKADKK